MNVLNAFALNSNLTKLFIQHHLMYQHGYSKISFIAWSLEADFLATWFLWVSTR